MRTHGVALAIGTVLLAAPAVAQQAGTGLKPRGITIEVPLEHTIASGGVPTLVGRRTGPTYFAGPGQPPLPLFLNRNGGRYSPGRDDSRANTSIIPNQASTVTAFGGSEAQWRAVVDCVRAQFAPFNTVVVETEPAGGEYVEAVIGGRPGQVGLPNGVGGVAPIDSFQCNIIPNAIVFAFSDVYGNNPQDVCETAAQEIAHAISLDHELHCPDPMTYLSGCGNKSFRDVDSQCGEYQARACNCGRQRQNSVRVLTQKLGASSGTNPPLPNDTTPPTVAITSPATGDTLPNDSVITVTANASDNNAIAAVELVWNFSNAAFPCPTNQNGGSVVCALNNGTATWNIRVGQGDRTFSVRARDLNGNQAVTPERTIHLGTPGTPPPPTDTTLPTVAITAPVNGATMPGSRTIQVVATARDETQLGSVELVWAYGNDSFPCPVSSQGVSCTVAGDSYTWSLNVGLGTRQFVVRAIDAAGNTANTPEFNITLVNDQMMPPVNPGPDTVAEDNDTAAEAFPTRCGNAIDLVVASDDEDWFAYDAPNGTEVEIGVTANMGPIGVELYADDGVARLANSDDITASGGTVRATSLGPRILARVTTTQASATYRLTAVCSAANPPTPQPTPEPTTPPVVEPPAANPPAAGSSARRRIEGGCACGATEGAGGDVALMLVGLALWGLVRRRR